MYARPQTSRAVRSARAARGALIVREVVSAGRAVSAAGLKARHCIYVKRTDRGRIHHSRVDTVCSRLLFTGMLAGSLAFSSGCTERAPSRVSSEWSTLPAADARLLEGFTTPGAVVERANGKALVSDRRHRELWLVDFTTGRRTPFGRSGDGPGEFRSVHAVLPMAADSVAVLSHGVPYRVSILTDEGRPIRTWTMGNFISFAEAALKFESYPVLEYADTAGRFYGARVALGGTSGSIEYMDSVPIMRVELSTERIDTVAIFHTGEWGSFRRPTADSLHYRAGRGVYAAINDWTVTPDGTLVMLDAKSYTITLVSPSGSVRRVPVKNPHPKYEIGAREWQRHSDSATRVVGLRMKQSLGQISARMGTRLQTPDYRNLVMSPESPVFWPPVLTSSAPMKTANSMLWIPVTGPESPRRKYWDVVSLDGTVKQSFVSDRNQYLLEVTSEHLYMVTVDNDDVRWVSRHPNPMR